jgi:hypothetical protein
MGRNNFTDGSSMNNQKVKARTGNPVRPNYIFRNIFMVMPET